MRAHDPFVLSCVRGCSLCFAWAGGWAGVWWGWWLVGQTIQSIQSGQTTQSIQPVYLMSSLIHGLVNSFVISLVSSLINYLVNSFVSSLVSSLINCLAN